MSPRRTTARRWLLERGLPVSIERDIAALICATEKRVLDAVARHDIGLANVIAAEFAQPVSVPPLDGDAQPSEHVTDQLRAAAAAGS